MADDFWAGQSGADPSPGGPHWAKLAEQIAGLGYWRLDVGTGAINWSDGLFRQYGLPVGDMPDLQTAMAAIHPDDQARANFLLTHAMKTGESYTDEVRLKRADGTWRTMFNRTVSRRDPAGGVQTLFGVVMDITEISEANAALRASEERYRRLAENGNDLIVHIDLDGVITYISPSAEAVTGYRPEELVGRRVDSFLGPEPMAALESQVDALLASGGGKAECVEYPFRHKDGREIWLEARPTPLFDPVTGEAIGITDVVRDVTERKALERELTAKCEEAQAATRVKAEFLANMSHEIRTPLTAIMGFSGLLARQESLPEEARSHIKRIVAAGEQLLNVVNDVLDFSRLDAGQVVLDPQPTSPATLIAETAELMTATARAKGLGLRTVAAPGLPELVLLDAGRVRQVLLNLIGNAVKFTCQGEVVVSAARAGEGRIRFSVADTGPGIPDALHGKLFERFSQVDGSISRGHGGAGLGLAICKGLVEVMGGRIGFDSTEGEGARFWFTLPAKTARQRAVPAADDPMQTAAARPLHILVVDDLEVNRQLVRAMLEPLGHSFEEASGGVEAVAAAVRRPFDLILMDLQMPGMDGLEAARAIRATAEANRATPIVALSANVLADHVAACRAAGMDDHLAKPIVPAALVAATIRWAKSEARRAA